MGIIDPNIRDFVDENALDEHFDNYCAIFESKNPDITNNPTDEEIIKAIKNRYYIGIYYEEKSDTDEEIVKKGFRLIEPYVFGYGYNYRGKILHEDRRYLRAFVVRDTKYDDTFKNKKNFTRRKSVSKSKKLPYWRIFRIDRISDWQIIPRKISKYREMYNENDKLIANIEENIEKTSFPKGEQKIKKY